MKKILNIALTALLCVAAFQTTVSAHKDYKSWGDIPKTSEKITVDGKIDDIYKKGLAVDVALADGGKTAATGKAYFLWSDDGIYCAIEVKDDEICEINSAKNAWDLDGIKLSYDYKNDGSTRHKWTIHWDGGFTASGDGTTDEIELATTYTDKSYIVETKVDLADGLGADSGIGINLLIDDSTGNNTTGTIVRSAQSGGATENEVAKFDYVVLSDKKVANNTAKPSSAAQTADMTAVAALALAASGVFVFSKKRK